MVPKLAQAGRSFKGAAAYYLHDKRQAGESRRDTSERVAWAETVNLPTDDPDRAWRMMAHTAMCQSDLKRAAGIKASGRKLENPTLAYSLSWHPDEKPTATEQRQAALDSLKALGLDQHQSIIIAHNDQAHPHVHVLVNRIDPGTGVAAKLSKSKLVLSQWAQEYERSRGRVFCQERVENNARRAAMKPGRAADNRSRDVPNREREAAKGRPKAAAERARDHADRFADQAATERSGQHRRAGQKEKLHAERRTSRNAVRDRAMAVASVQVKADGRLTDMLELGKIDPAMTELTRSRSTFTKKDMERLVGRHTRTDETFKAVMAKIDASPELVPLGRDERGQERFTTRAQQSVEQQMERHARLLHANKRILGDIAPKWAGKISLSADQDKALKHVLKEPGLSAVIGYAGSGKSTLLNSARQSWEAAGYRVLGATLSGIAADGLKNGAGIDSRTIHSRLFQWEQGQNKLTPRDVLVIDEAGMVGTRQMERLLAHALEAKARVVLVGDAEQLQAIEAGGAFQAIVKRIGAAELTTVRRQKADWQQDATRELATAKTEAALQRYEKAGMVHKHEKNADAIKAMVDAWHAHRVLKPDETQIILAYTRADVRDLNDQARARMRDHGDLGDDHMLQTEQGKRAFASGDRIYFLKNDSVLDVRNGSLGTVEAIHGKRVTVKVDGEKPRRITFSLDDYNQFDHGYAATIHKSQGVTVDRAHLLASRNLDRHSAYVAMTRHRDRLDIHWSVQAMESRKTLGRVFSRKALKDTTLDYADQKEAAKEARRQAAADTKARIERRAKAFATRETTPAGRMANARSLLGSAASVIEVARLALNNRARSVKFRQQQATLRKWGNKLDPKPKAREKAAARTSVPIIPIVKLADALQAHDRKTLDMAERMNAAHETERHVEKDDRDMLQAMAAGGWEEEIAQLAELSIDRGLELRLELTPPPEKRPANDPGGPLGPRPLPGPWGT